MKKITLALFIISGISMLGSGCKKDEPDATPKGSDDGTMTAKIDGVDWASTSEQNTVLVYFGQGKRMDLRGVSDNGTQMILSMEDENFASDEMAVGTYTSGDNSSDNALFTYSTGGYSSGYFDEGGTITITAINATAKKVSGTFSFKTVNPFASSQDTVRVSNGTFTGLKYVVYK